MKFRLGAALLLALIFGFHIARAASFVVSVSQDDNNAILSWLGGETATPLAGIAGYRVVWGDTNNPAAHTAITAHKVYQVQPLVNGTVYTATVTSVDNEGNTLDTSAPISFTGDSSRVDALRQKMTGFFDDFNLPMGAPDEKKWNLAFSACNGPQSGFFINDQSHVHTMVQSQNCDRAQTVVRPRALFDFTDRTGTITFDFDGTQRRDQWYLDIVPNLMDITGQVNIEGGGTGNPGNMLRFHQNGQNLEILYVNANGFEQSLAKTDWNPYKPLDWAGLGLVSNVRRHWQLSVSQTSASIVVDGVEVLKAALDLPFSKAYVLNNTFSYNTPKSNEPYVVSHWDNFGFDGPASAETHNYRADVYDSSLSQSYTITIPDAVNAPARLMYTLQMPLDKVYTYSKDDHVTVNGQSFPMPQPIGVEPFVSSINPVSQVILIPAGVLTGKNTLTFSQPVLNVHVEFDVSGSYTPPPAIMPAMPVPAPGARIDRISGQDTGITGLVSQQSPHVVSGPFTLDVSASQDISMNATGKSRGIAGVELRVDKQSVWKKSLNDAPSYSGQISFNGPTGLYLPNGQHEIFFVAYDNAGQQSIPDYFQADSVAGAYYPVVFNVSGAPTPTAVPTPTVVPTPTALPDLTSSQVADAGVNLASACFTNAASLPGIYGTTYVYPTHAEIDYAVSKGESVVRICFQMENLMRTPGAEFDSVELGRLDDFVSYATGKGLKVIVDPHNFGRYYNKIIGADVPSGVLEDFWARLARHYATNSLVIDELMNEPNSESTDTWWAVAQATANAIRLSGATNLILVPGNGWDGADSWTFNWYDPTHPANDYYAAKFVDSNFAFEAHEYLDGQGGNSDVCTGNGPDGLINYVAWLRAHNVHGWLTEFGVGRNATCYAALDNMLKYMDANSDVLKGWTYWAAGPWWSDYRYTVEPDANGDRPQMKFLQQHFPKALVVPVLPTTDTFICTQTYKLIGGQLVPQDGPSCKAV